MEETILIADDDGDVRSIMRQCLERAGYVIAEAADGSQALAALRAMQFDLLITDLAMPEKDGLELLEALRYEKKMPKVIAMSGAWDGICLPAASKLGAQAALPKPWRNEMLLETVRTVLDGQTMVRPPKSASAPNSPRL